MRPPALRPLDAFPVSEDGRTWLALRDDEDSSGTVVLLSAVDAMIASRFDGRRTAEAVAADLARHGLPVGAARVAELARALDEKGLLDSPRFRRRARAEKASFRRLKARPAWLAGRSYPAAPAELGAALGALLDGAAPSAGRPTGLVAPHIDFPRGGPCYARAYAELAGPLPGLCVVIGVAHRTPPTPLVLAAKDFETPLGTLPLAAELAEALEAAAPYDLRADELVHRSEHSVEFQAVWLAQARGRLGGEPRILPLLASSCELDGAAAGARTERTLDALVGLLEPRKDDLLLVCGADLAHVGPRFGDSEAVSAARLAEVEARDREGLARLAAQDAEGWLSSVQSDGNSRRVCGVSALYAFARLHRALFPAARGELLSWGHAADPAGGEVSFAALAFR